MRALYIRSVSKSFQDKRVIEKIDLEIERGEIFIFVGPSGSGKSTLLRIASGLERASGGSVELGEGIAARDISFVFQQFALLPWLSVFQNVELGLIARGIGLRERRHTVLQELKTLGLEALANYFPRQLSGGQKQRVGIARALVTNPKVIFMDEPFSELDSFTASKLRKELLTIWQERRPTIVMVTHIVKEAIELGDRIAVLTPQPARIESIARNDLPRPRQERSAEFYKIEDRITALVEP